MPTMNIWNDDNVRPDGKITRELNLKNLIKRLEIASEQVGEEVMRLAIQSVIDELGDVRCIK